jgi:inosine/xanthosine triphosphate pyrophosphatase family protein
VIDGKTWYCLFGVNKTNKFGYDDVFWTKKSEMNPKTAEKFENSFKFRAFYNLSIK